MSDKLPALQFYPGDWRKDVGVQSLNLHDRGAWFEILMLMHESTPRGMLILNGKPMPEDALGRLLGLDNQSLKQTLSALLSSGVASIDQDTSALMNRRMVRDEKLRQIRKEAGKLGGNPILLNQNSTIEDKQKPTPSSSSSSSNGGTEPNAPPQDPPPAAPIASIESENPPDGLGSLQYANGLLERCHIPHDFGTQRAAAAAIDAYAKERGLPKHQATAELIKIARADIAGGTTITKFWFLDGKYRGKMKRAAVQTKPTEDKPVHQYESHSIPLSAIQALVKAQAAKGRHSVTDTRTSCSSRMPQ